jgi:hypothetical protein
VITTCSTYLLLICTEGRDAKKGDLVSGFTKSLGKQSFYLSILFYSIITKYEGNETKPVPRRLQLRSEHVSFLGGTIKFTPARFNITSSNDDDMSSRENFMIIHLSNIMKLL